MARRTTRTVTLCALLAGVALALLLPGCFLPSGRMGLAALAGLSTATAVCAAGYGAGLGCYAASALLALLVLPGKEVAVYYALLFGPYPLLKARIEALRRPAIEWPLKLALGAALMTLVFQVLKRLLGVTITLRGLGSWGLLLAGLIVFVCYDVAFSRVMTYVQRRLLPLLRGGRSGGR